MKSFELKQVKFVAYEQEQTLDYRELLKLLMEAPQDVQKGAGIDEVRKSIRILDALDATDGDLLQLEDADASYLAQRVKSARFTSNSQVFIDFVEHFNGNADESR